MKKLTVHIGIIAAIAMLAAACGKKEKQVTRAFYHWKTNVDISVYEDRRMQELSSEKIYIRMFDVDWNDATQQPQPVAVAAIRNTGSAQRFVPVVFVTLRTINHLADTAQAAALARNMAKLLAQQAAQVKLPFDEVQIDCDWTQQTKEKYFALLRHLRKQPAMQDKKLSVTIRLHQVKYLVRNGTPPADRGLLMYYNMGNMSLAGNHNSILDAGEAKKYLNNLSGYPLPLDIALPLYSWCLVFEDRKFNGILRDIYPEDIAAQPFFTKQGDNLYACTADTTFKGFDFRKGEVVRTESSDLKALQDIANYTASRLRNDRLSVILYHCDSIPLAKFSTDELETVYSSFSP